MMLLKRGVICSALCLSFAIQLALTAIASASSTTPGTDQIAIGTAPVSASATHTSHVNTVENAGSALSNTKSTDVDSTAMNTRPSATAETISNASQLSDEDNLMNIVKYIILGIPNQQDLEKKLGEFVDALSKLSSEINGLKQKVEILLVNETYRKNLQNMDYTRPGLATGLTKISVIERSLMLGNINECDDKLTEILTPIMAQQQSDNLESSIMSLERNLSDFFDYVVYAHLSKFLQSVIPLHEMEQIINRIDQLGKQGNAEHTYWFKKYQMLKSALQLMNLHSVGSNMNAYFPCLSGAKTVFCDDTIISIESELFRTNVDLDESQKNSHNFQINTMYSIFSFAKKNSKLFPEYPVFFVRLVMNAVLLHNSINMSDENKVLRKKLNSVIIAVADKLALEQNKLNEIEKLAAQACLALMKYRNHPTANLKTNYEYILATIKIIDNQKAYVNDKIQQVLAQLFGPMTTAQVITATEKPHFEQYQKTHSIMTDIYTNLEKNPNLYINQRAKEFMSNAGNDRIRPLQRFSLALVNLTYPQPKTANSDAIRYGDLQLITMQNILIVNHILESNSEIASKLFNMYNLQGSVVLRGIVARCSSIDLANELGNHKVLGSHLVKAQESLAQNNITEMPANFFIDWFDDKRTGIPIILQYGFLKLRDLLSTSQLNAAPIIAEHISYSVKNCKIQDDLFTETGQRNFNEINLAIAIRKIFSYEGTDTNHPSNVFNQPTHMLARADPIRYFYLVLYNVESHLKIFSDSTLLKILVTHEALKRSFVLLDDLKPLSNSLIVVRTIAMISHQQQSLFNNIAVYNNAPFNYIVFNRNQILVAEVILVVKHGLSSNLLANTVHTLLTRLEQSQRERAHHMGAVHCALRDMAKLLTKTEVGVQLGPHLGISERYCNWIEELYLQVDKVTDWDEVFHHRYQLFSQDPSDENIERLFIAISELSVVEKPLKDQTKLQLLQFDGDVEPMAYKNHDWTRIRYSCPQIFQHWFRTIPQALLFNFIETLPSTKLEITSLHSSVKEPGVKLDSLCLRYFHLISKVQFTIWSNGLNRTIFYKQSGKHKELVEIDLHLSEPCQHLTILMEHKLRLLLWFDFNVSELSADDQHKYSEMKTKLNQKFDNATQNSVKAIENAIAALNEMKYFRAYTDRNSQVRRVHFDSLVLSKIAGDVLPDGAAGIN